MSPHHQATSADPMTADTVEAVAKAVLDVAAAVDEAAEEEVAPDGTTINSALGDLTVMSHATNVMRRDTTLTNAPSEIRSRRIHALSAASGATTVRCC